MGYRRLAFAPGEVYHLASRGVEQRTIFEDDADRERFVLLLRYCRTAGPLPSLSTALRLRPQSAGEKRDQLVDVLCYCLMLNHVHVLIRETTTGGISKYMQRVLNGHARYFNVRHKRSGTLFGQRFHASHISTTELLLHVSRYIHLNPYVAGLVRDPTAYRWSSIGEYLGSARDGFCETRTILDIFDADSYQSFILDHADYARSLAHSKAKVLEPGC